MVWFNRQAKLCQQRGWSCSTRSDRPGPHLLLQPSSTPRLEQRAALLRPSYHKTRPTCQHPQAHVAAPGARRVFALRSSLSKPPCVGRTGGSMHVRMLCRPKIWAGISPTKFVQGEESVPFFVVEPKFEEMPGPETAAATPDSRLRLHRTAWCWLHRLSSSPGLGGVNSSHLFGRQPLSDAWPMLSILFVWPARVPDVGALSAGLSTIRSCLASGAPMELRPRLAHSWAGPSSAQCCRPESCTLFCYAATA